MGKSTKKNHHLKKKIKSNKQGCLGDDKIHIIIMDANAIGFILLNVHP
jgi:hypothetical protein